MSHAASSPSRQERLLAFLASPDSYPHRPASVELIQTHISIVALAPPWVYKIKKPVDFGFLDFTTLEQRRHYCEEEVRLNRRLCEELYVGVVPLYGAADTFSWTEGDDVVEVAVKMHQLDPAYFLDAWLDRDALTDAHLDRVVERLAAFYEALPGSPAAASWGRPQRLRISIDENFDQTEAMVGQAVSAPAFEALRFFMDRFLDAHARLLHHRRSAGHVVDGHGDLRLEHIHLTDERVCIYDCIEFSQRLRAVDVANDVAFLAMDLDMHDRPALARTFADRMADALDDPDLLHLIDFYKSYRAHVRAKIEGFQDLDAMTDPQRHRHQQRARRFFQLALRYAVADSGPFVLIVMGSVATGKSTQAATLGDVLGWPVVSSDRVRKETAGVPLHERPDDATRDALYAAERTETVYATLAEDALTHAAQGRGIILDATFSRRTHRDALRERLRSQKTPYCVVELTARDEVIRARLAQREDSADVVSDARLADLSMLRDRYEPPDAREDAFHLTIDASGTPDETTQQILTDLIRLRL
ncbi:MAG: AAA family ATPase [Bacteroidetes bacterium]|jgi:aminoglycoside phosphotransferase family enzyme/predicted kinase|nr:AAA family ATPase [Bacteroidota bacterium]